MNQLLSLTVLVIELCYFVSEKITENILTTDISNNFTTDSIFSSTFGGTNITSTDVSLTDITIIDVNFTSTSHETVTSTDNGRNILTTANSNISIIDLSSFSTIYDTNISTTDVTIISTTDIKVSSPTNGENISITENANISSTNISSISTIYDSNISTTISTNDENNLELDWVTEAIKDVTYYLRAHKFNEYDRRYNKNADIPGKYFAANPKPPLRSLHWEVMSHCDTSFLKCIEFLNKRVKQTGLQRRDDTSIIISEQKWHGSNYSDQIKMVENECKQLRDRDNILATPFQGPLERYQWRTTANYYLCWYAMNEVQYLKHIGESCDNFATCLDAKFGASNRDPRAADSEDFGCVLYSTCPDPCCPVHHIASFDECWNSQVNPCFKNNPIGHRKCVLERKQNTDLTDIVLNRWNVTCECTNPGYVWESQYGTCVDVNECSDAMHNCDEKREICVNLPGSYRCVCNWGYIFNKEQAICEKSRAFDIIQRHRAPIVHSNEPFTIISTVKRLTKKLFHKSFAQRLYPASCDRTVAWIVVALCYHSCCFLHNTCWD